jgi:hypothetical protein
VDQPLDAVLDARERAEVGELGDLAADELADLVLVADLAPRLGLGPLEREGDLALLRVDPEDEDLDLLADPQDLRWVADPAPRELGEVDEPVRAADVDEGAEVADRGDPTLADLALLQLLDQPLLHHVAAFLDGLPLGEDERFRWRLISITLSGRLVPIRRAMSACLLPRRRRGSRSPARPGRSPRTPSRFTRSRPCCSW